MKKNVLRVLAGCRDRSLLNQCAVQFYPRPVTPSEKSSSNFAHAFDSFAAMLLRDLQAKDAKKPENQKILIDSYMFYADPKFHDPKNFYPEPGPMKDLKMDLWKETKDYKIFYVTWPSQYKPVNPDFARLYDTYREDWTVYALYYKLKKPSQAAVVMTHGWTGGDIRGMQQSSNRVTQAALARL